MAVKSSFLSKIRFALSISIAAILLIPAACAYSDMGWFGEENQGGGAALADLNNNGQLDLVVLNIDNPDGENNGYYRVGFDLKSNGDALWTSTMKIPGWFGAATAAGDIALADLNNNGQKDMVIFHIDDPEGENRGWYRVAWDLKADGQVGRWDSHLGSPVNIPGWFGAENGGAGVALADINDNGKQDLVIFHIDNPDGENRGWYRIGWDLDEKGEVGSWDPVMIEAPLPVEGWFGEETQGGDVTLADLNKNGYPELMVFHIDNPDDSNSGWYRIGWDMDKSGRVAKWDKPVNLDGWFGDESSAAGIDVMLNVDNGANVLYFTVGRFVPSFGEGGDVSNHGYFYFAPICWGPCSSQFRNATVLSSGEDAGFIEEPSVVPVTVIATAIAEGQFEGGSQPAPGNLEENTNRPGSDYRDFDLSVPNPELCRMECDGDPKCKAFTYVKPDMQGSSARCWLKDEVPDPVPGDCCVSGVKSYGMQMMSPMVGIIQPS